MNLRSAEAPYDRARDFDPVVVVAAWGLVTVVTVLVRTCLAGLLALAFAWRTLSMTGRAPKPQRRFAGRQLDDLAGSPRPR